MKWFTRVDKEQTRRSDHGQCCGGSGIIYNGDFKLKDDSLRSSRHWVRSRSGTVVGYLLLLVSMGVLHL